MNENLARSLRLLLVTDDQFLADGDGVARIEAAVKGGATAVQLRLKHARDCDFIAIGRQLVGALPVPVLVNDRLDIALACGAAGVHLGSDDLAPRLARAIVPPGFIIGASVGSADEVSRGWSADYWGIGPLRPTTTKTDAGSALGWDGAGTLLTQADHRPCVLIGGIVPMDVAEAMSRGFAGVAVASGILGAADTATAAAAYCPTG